MILDKLENASLYTGYGRHIKTALDFMRDFDFATAQPGRIEIDGSNVFAYVKDLENETEIVNTHTWEAHKEYIDIWAITNDTPELVGWRKLEGLKEIDPYDAVNDITFFEATDEYSLFRFEKGYFVLFDTNDAHMVGSFACPGHDTHVRVLIIKIKI